MVKGEISGESNVLTGNLSPKSQVLKGVMDRSVRTPNYNELANKPSINGETLVGNKSSADLHIVEDKTFVYIQAVPSSEWRIEHNLGKFPAVTVIDSAGTEVFGDVRHLDENTVVLSFSGAFSGKAFFN